MPRLLPVFTDITLAVYFNTYFEIDQVNLQVSITVIFYYFILHLVNWCQYKSIGKQFHLILYSKCTCLSTTVRHNFHLFGNF